MTRAAGPGGTMNGEILFNEFEFSLARKPQRFFRAAVALSVAFHVAAFLTSPWWQARTRSGDVLTVDIAPIPEEELPRIQDLPAAKPIALPAAPRVREAPAPEQPDAPPNREAIRERVAGKGLLRMLDGRTPQALPKIDLPRDLRLASNRAPAPGDFRPAPHPDDEALAARTRETGIGKQVTATARSSAPQASRVFKTDAGLEAEIHGGLEDQSRSGSAIANAIRQYQSGIRYAYNKELLANPNISGRITVSFVIQPDGRVESAEVRQSTVGWPPLEEAVIRRMLHWKFARSGGAPVRVTFPFVFHPEM